MTVFAELRRALEEQRDLIEGRLEAVEQAESALARMAAVFGVPAGAPGGAQDARVTLAGTIPRRPTRHRPLTKPPRKKKRHRQR